MAAKGGAAAISEGGEAGVVDDLKDGTEGFNEDLEGKIREDEGEALEAGGEELGAVGREVK